MAKHSPGLSKRGQIWHIKKRIGGRLLCESTGESELEAAERYLAKRIQEIRAVAVYGQRETRLFDHAAARYIEEYGHKRSIDRDIVTLKAVMPYLGAVPLQQIHAGGELARFIADRKRAGIQPSTLNRDLAIIGRVLTLCARLWRDEQGRPWLDSPPMLPRLASQPRKPRPITQAEQSVLLQHLPAYLAEMALFALHTGLRDQELCGLRWEHEARVEGSDARVFIIPAERSKNGRERLVPLNAVARSIIESRRGGDGYVFDLDGHRLGRMGGKAWQKGRAAAGLPGVRVHDLRHTFGMRLRAAGVGLEDRQDLLGHHAGRITTHYSRAEIANLIACVQLLCAEGRRPELSLIRTSR